MSTGRISIIVPAYNAEDFIARALASALEQTYHNLEVILVDDGSTDATASIVRSIPDPRLGYVYQPNGGQGRARNRGVQISSGEYITFLDADDFYLPRKVEQQVEFLRAHPEFKLVYCSALHYRKGRPEIVYRSRTRGRSGRLLPELLQTSYINPNTVMMARGVLDQIGGFNETRYFPEEWELWCRLTLAGHAFGYLDEDLVVVEIREDSNTTMEIQPVLKQNAVRMFQTVWPRVVELDGDRYPTAPAIRALKWKQAVAHAAVGERRQAFRLATELVRPPVLGYAVGVALMLLPSRFLRWFWRKRQMLKWDVAEGVRIDDARGHLLPLAQ